MRVEAAIATRRPSVIPSDISPAANSVARVVGVGLGQSEHPQQVLGELVRRAVDGSRLACGQAQMQYAEQRAAGAGDGHRGVLEPQSAGVLGSLQIPQGSRCQSGVRGDVARPDSVDDLCQLGVRSGESCGDAHRCCEDLGRVLDVGGDLVEHRAVLLDDLVDGGFEELLLGVEVVVERAETHVGGVGELLDADLTRLTGGQHRLGGRHQRGAGALPPAVGTVSGRRLTHVRSLDEISPDLVITPAMVSQAAWSRTDPHHDQK
jgi:hypothetical protein